MTFLIAATSALAAVLPLPRVQPWGTPAALTQGSEADALRLLPGESLLVVRLQSIEALLELVNRFGAASGAPAFTSTELLEDLNVPGDAAHIDATRPIWLAFSQSPAPTLTFALPARDAQAMSAALELEGEGVVLASGGYVGMSNGSSLELQAEPPALAAKMRPGLVSMHVDLAKLIEIYRPFIDMGLEQVETQLDMEASSAPDAPDMAPLIEAYLDLTWDFIDSAEHLDLVLAQQGTSLELLGTLSTLEKSPLSSWGAGPPIELGAWPAQIDPTSMFCVAYAGDWADMMKRMQPMTELSLGMYPEALQGFMRESIAASGTMYGLMGSMFAAGDLGQGGMRVGYVVGSEKPGELAAAMTALMQKLPTGDEGIGIRFTPPEPVEIGPVKAQRTHVEIDAAELGRAMGAPLGESDVHEVEQAMQALFGPGGLDITLATHVKSLAVAVGGDEAFAKSVLVERGPAGAAVPIDLQRALAAVSGSSSALVYRFDFGRLMAQIGDLASALGEDTSRLDALPNAPLAACVWGAIRGREWSSGTLVELESLLAFVKATAEAQPNVGDDEELTQALAQMHLTMIAGALELYAAQNGGTYPESLEVLVRPDVAGETYIASLPSDPWGNAYVYEAPRAEGQSFKLLTYGADGAPGGEGVDSDIDYESLRAGR